MLHVLGCITGQHDLRLVVLAGFICAFASWTAISLLWRARLSPKYRNVWTIGAGAVFGAGVWATHFVAMLAYHSAAIVGYDELLTSTSIVFAIFVSTIGFALILRGFAVAGGVVAGFAVVGMHYLGVSALAGPFDFTWDEDYVIASVVISLMCGALAALAGTRIRNIWGRVLAAAMFTIGIVGLHFTAMSALTLTLASGTHGLHPMLVRGSLAIAIAAIAFLIVALGLMSALLDKHLVIRRGAEERRLRAYVTALETSQIELQQTSADLRIALAKADAANNAKSAFLAAMSHELRTPLNAILGFSDFLLSGKVAPDSGRYREYLGDIRQSGGQLLTLINNILDLVRADSGQISMREETLSLSSLCLDCIDAVSAEAEAGEVEIDMNVPAALSIVADEKLLSRALGHLLSNAVKFTPPGGHVHLSADPSAGGIAIAVTDSGIGMAPEHVVLALERFGQVDSRLSRKYEGTGLGLPLAKQFVVLHDGHLSIESAVGGGTTVTISLPPERLVHSAKAA